MTRTQEVTLDQLNTRRDEILSGIGMSYDELAARAEAHTLIGDELAAWEEIREIDFLRNA